MVEHLSSKHQAGFHLNTKGKMFTKGVTRTSAPHRDTVRVWIRADFRAGSLGRVKLVELRPGDQGSSVPGPDWAPCSELGAWLFFLGCHTRHCQVRVCMFLFCPVTIPVTLGVVWST